MCIGALGLVFRMSIYILCRYSVYWLLLTSFDGTTRLLLLLMVALDKWEDTGVSMAINNAPLLPLIWLHEDVHHSRSSDPTICRIYGIYCKIYILFRFLHCRCLVKMVLSELLCVLDVSDNFILNIRLNVLYSLVVQIQSFIPLWFLWARSFLTEGHRRKI